MDEPGSSDLVRPKEVSMSSNRISCPTSLNSLMSNSQHGQVVFNDVYDLYPTDSDLNCRFTIPDTVRARSGDRIGLFKVGWDSVAEYKLTIFVPIPMYDWEQQPSVTLRGSFHESSLPKDSDELYQFIYLSLDNKVHGASTPFSLRRPHENEICGVEDKANPGLIIYKSRMGVLHDKIAALEEEREETELKVSALNGKITILEKELSATLFMNKDISESLTNAKEDVNLLTEKLSQLTEEFKELLSTFKRHEVSYNNQKTDCEMVSAKLKEKDEELLKVKEELINVRQLKSEAEVNTYSSTRRITILEKELSSTSNMNKDLTESLKNSKEDVDSLTEKLTQLTKEFEELQSTTKEHEFEFNNKNSDCGMLSLKLNEKDDELQRTKSELNSVRQEKIHAELILKEVSNYNAKLKEDIDNLMHLNALRASCIMERAKEEINEGQTNQHDSQQQQPNEPASESNIASNEQPDCASVNDLQAQLSEALKLLDETLQNQHPSNEEREAYVRELEGKINCMTEEHSEMIATKDAMIASMETAVKQLEEQCKQTDENNALNNTIARQYEEIRNLSDKILQLKSSNSRCLLREQQLLEEIKESNQAKETALNVNKSIMERVNSLENTMAVNKNKYDSTIASLNNEIAKLAQVSDAAKKVEELETVVRCLRAALMTKPALEEFCQMIFESTRVLAMDTYKDLFDSVQFLDMENAEIGLKVRRLLDEFGILKQDLDRCRHENQTAYKELDQIKNDFTKISDENEFHKDRIVELNEALSEMRNCLDAVKKENNEMLQAKEATKTEYVETHKVNELKVELENIKMKKDDLEKQLKEAKIANALTNIGRVSIDQPSLLVELEELRSKVKELESDKNSGPTSYQKCCAKMQEQLKKSAIEYAKLYQQLETERESYKKLFSSLNNFQSPSRSLLKLAATDDGQNSQSS